MAAVTTKFINKYSLSLPHQFRLIKRVFLKKKYFSPPHLPHLRDHQPLFHGHPVPQEGVEQDEGGVGDVGGDREVGSVLLLVLGQRRGVLHIKEEMAGEKKDEKIIRFLGKTGTCGCLTEVPNNS